VNAQLLAFRINRDLAVGARESIIVRRVATAKLYLRCHVLLLSDPK
jgi:hypothetical protein